ncbi:MAG: tRNA 2-thiocytidine biosynthesis protein TtcA [Oscillospiraceae bacterium]|nr:tRNA 2-thiocytidine biosynthesis protein TtcA [Oscillospiraceae bacterium]
MARELAFYEQAERSIVKKYRRELWTPFITAVQRYALVEKGDRIAVCVSGGKDSMLLAKLMQELARHGHTPFEAVYLCMDPGYSAANRARIEENADKLRVPLTIFESDVFAVANAQARSACYLCAKMRRGHLYAKARELGCNKIALGHHFNDVIETTVMGMLWSGQLQAMPPKLHSQNFPGMELIRPLYRVHEDDVIAWARHHDLAFLQCACRFTEASAHNERLSKRKEVKALLRSLRAQNPNVEKSVFNAIHTVNIDTFPGWKSGGEVHTFLENYENFE